MKFGDGLTPSLQSQVTAALGATIGLHVPEILREAGPKVASFLNEADGLLTSYPLTLGPECQRDRGFHPGRPLQAWSVRFQRSSITFSLPCVARIMRILAAHHIYIETSPDVFVYNRTSSILDSGKSVAAILQE